MNQGSRTQIACLINGFLAVRWQRCSGPRKPPAAIFKKRTVLPEVAPSPQPQVPGVSPQPELPQPAIPCDSGRSRNAIVVVAVLCQGQIVCAWQGAQEKLELSTQLGTIEFGQSLKATVEAHVCAFSCKPVANLGAIILILRPLRASLRLFSFLCKTLCQISRAKSKVKHVKAGMFFRAEMVCLRLLACWRRARTWLLGHAFSRFELVKKEDLWLMG